MSKAPAKAAARYVTVSLRPETHRRLLAMLRPRETMDELVMRLYDAYPQTANSTKGAQL